MKVSVLMPVYNRENLIGECIESILSQTFHDFELIIIDDGSTDATVSVIESFHDSRIKFFKCEHNGIVDALNFGLSKCSGEYVARMDSDDIMVQDRLEKQVGFLDSHDNVDLLCTSWHAIAGNVTIDRTISKEPLLVTKEYLLRTPIVLHPTIMFRIESFKRLGFCYDKEYEFLEDYSLFLKMAETEGYSMHYEPSIKAIVKRTELDSVSVTKRRRIAFLLNKIKLNHIKL